MPVDGHLTNSFISHNHRSPTCPQCRCLTGRSTLTRIYFDIAPPEVNEIQPDGEAAVREILSDYADRRLLVNDDWNEHSETIATLKSVIDQQCEDLKVMLTTIDEQNEALLQLRNDIRRRQETMDEMKAEQSNLNAEVDVWKTTGERYNAEAQRWKHQFAEKNKEMEVDQMRMVSVREKSMALECQLTQASIDNLHIKLDMIEKNKCISKLHSTLFHANANYADIMRKVDNQASQIVSLNDTIASLEHKMEGMILKSPPNLCRELSQRSVATTWSIIENYHVILVPVTSEFIAKMKAFGFLTAPPRIRI